MLNKLNIFEIRKDALNALKSDSLLWEFRLIYYWFPLVLAGITFYLDYNMNTRLFRNLISGISLFAGMLFSIVFIVTDNFRERKKRRKTKNEADIAYINRYKKFSNDIIALISYVVIKAILVIIILLFSDAYKDYIGGESDLFLRAIWSLLIFLIIQFLMYIIVILKEMYAMQYEDINN